MAKWILNRLFEASDPPSPRFAYQSTVNWMEALAIICRSESFSHEELKAFYLNTQRQKINREADTLAYENLVMALHNIASLKEMSKQGKDHNAFVRSAIIAWYYTIYYASSAMIAAASGSKQETHATTARVWQNDIVNNDLAVGPFGLSLNTLVKNDVEKTIARLRNGNNFRLVNVPTNKSEAWGAVCSYLSGTADFEKDRVEERIRGRKDFKDLNVNNFRTTAARELRDSKLKKGIVNFLTQSFRYRGKANYRDSLYLSYGENRSEGIKVLVHNLDFVAATFMKMACHYISKRVEKGTWSSFLDDLQQNLTINIDQGILPT